MSSFKPQIPLSLLLLLAQMPFACAREDSDFTDLGWRSKAQIQALPKEEQPRLDHTCSGAFLIVPIPITPVPVGEIWGYSDELHAQETGLSEMQGHVTLKQEQQQMDGDYAALYRDRNYVEAQGHLRVAEPGYAAAGDSGKSHLDSKETTIEKARYAVSKMHAHGKAQSIWRAPDGLTVIRNGEISTCEPGTRAWHLDSNRIKLNPISGRGEAISSLFYVHEVPVVYIPYINFPIDDRRQTGILYPEFGSSNVDGVSFVLPVYLNLAPNYDATITPRLISRRGDLVEGEFRYLETWGHGTVLGGYLNKDRLDNDLTRKSGAWRHDGSFAPGWTAKTDINYVSDDYYFHDLATDIALSNTAYQQRLGQVSYADQHWTWLLKAQSFQTLDPLDTNGKPIIPDSSKPYARLPETALTGLWRTNDLHWESGFTTDYVNFTRTIADQSGQGVNGERLRTDPFARYLLTSPWGHLTSTLKVRQLNYQLTPDTSPGSAPQTVPIPSTASVTVPTVSIDGGLVFERELSEQAIQTLEPRIYYLAAPFRDQGTLPNFDTTQNTMSYAQLFRDSRFAGGDRLDDASQLSVGVTSRLLSASNGAERLRVSAGDIFYFRDREVIADLPPDTTRTSGLVGETVLNVTPSTTITANAVMGQNLQYTQRGSLLLHWQPDNQRLLNIGYNFTRGYESLSAPLGLPVSSTNTVTPPNTCPVSTIPFSNTNLCPSLVDGGQQTNISAVLPLGERWQVLGQWQYDMMQGHTLQAIGGLQYESCCWRIRLLSRSYLDTFMSTDLSTHYNRSYFVQFELKGLGGYGHQITTMLNTVIPGFKQISNAEHP